MGNGFYQMLPQQQQMNQQFNPQESMDMRFYSPYQQSYPQPQMPQMQQYQIPGVLTRGPWSPHLTSMALPGQQPQMPDNFRPYTPGPDPKWKQKRDWKPRNTKNLPVYRPVNTNTQPKYSKDVQAAINRRYES